MAVLTYKCPNCDGGLVFDPQKQAFSCEYCGSVFTQEQLDALAPAQAADQKVTAEEAQAAAPEQVHQPGETVLYTCPSCGAEVACDATTAATYCYYCHNPVVLAGRLDGAYEPDLVLPFFIDRDKAIALFLADVKGKWFVPRDFFSAKEIDSLTGVYFPHWVVDSDLDAAISGTGTTVRVWRMGDVEYTETKFFEVRRAGRLRFEELTRNALKSENRELVEGVLPFSLAQAKEYSPGFLQGFQAQKRDTEADELREGVRQELSTYAQRLLRDTAPGYTSLLLDNSRCDVAADQWRYALLPVWVLTYRSRAGKLWHYAINGQNGRVYGSLPVSRGRLAALFGGVSAAVFALLTLMGGYLR